MSTSTEESQLHAVQRRAAGEFVRGISGVRHSLTSLSAAVPSSEVFSPLFPAEPHRYHLFVGLSCPWCHRVMLARGMLGLEDSITVDVCFPNRTLEDDPVGAGKWEFNPTRVASLTNATLPECTAETATGNSYRLVQDIYQAQGVQETSVPILYDKKSKQIVSNESAEIIRMFDQFSAELIGSTTPSSTTSSTGIPTTANSPPLRLYPSDGPNPKPKLCAAIDALNEKTYVNINNGAYKAGFSSNQDVYAKAFKSYFDTLDELEKLLSSPLEQELSEGDDGSATATAPRRFLLSNTQPTEADLRLYPTLYRHDPVYYTRMKLNGARMVDYPRLWRWLCRMYTEVKGVASSCSLVHCRQGYFGRTGNNTVPLGPFKPMWYPEAYEHPELAGPM